jgi:hypothetical protein
VKTPQPCKAATVTDSISFRYLQSLDINQASENLFIPALACRKLKTFRVAYRKVVKKKES